MTNPPLSALIGKAIGYIVAISVTAVFVAVVYKVIMWVVNF